LSYTWQEALGVSEKGDFTLRKIATVLLVLILLPLVACGEGEEKPAATVTPSPTASPTPSAASPTATSEVTPSLASPSPPPQVSVPTGKLAFISRRDGNSEVYLVSPEGDLNLTNNPAEDIDADVSPDGNKIAFASNRQPPYQIYVMNIDGTDLRSLTDSDVGDFTPEWSPDGTHIAFTRGGSVMLMDSDGGNVQRIAQGKPETTAAPCEGGAFLGGWSPDGQQLTYYTGSAVKGVGQVCTIGINGLDLTVVASEPPAYYVEPSWSPDGDWIAYRFIDPESDNYEIYKVRPDGTSRTNLTNSPGRDIEPDWSPDGKWIVFASDRLGDMDLFIMKPDGSDVARITTALDKDSDPSWGP
jgi:TolB protein